MSTRQANMHLRVARPVTDLTKSVAQYRDGLGLEILGQFADHDGFDGVMLGMPEAEYHIELTWCRSHPVIPTPTQEDLLVFYVPQPQEWQERCSAMHRAGFLQVEPYNPYWKRSANTYSDRDGYLVVIAQATW